MTFFHAMVGGDLFLTTKNPFPNNKFTQSPLCFFNLITTVCVPIYYNIALYSGNKRYVLLKKIFSKSNVHIPSVCAGGIFKN
jgi:hypothetical protein